MVRFVARQIIELLRVRGIDRAGERVDKHLRPFASGRASSGKANSIPKTMFPD